jgi:hypoxanthine phosphoribosyltransferase
MKSEKVALFANIVGIVAGVVGLIPLYSFNPFLCMATFVVIVAWSSYILFGYKIRNLSTIKKGIISIEEKLKEDKYHPDILIAFTRSSAILAGMLAIRMKIEELLVINRRIVREKSKSPDFLQNYDVGYSISLNADELSKKRILIVYYVIETGIALMSGVDYLRSQGLGDNLKVVSLYASPDAQKRFPDVFAVHVTSSNVLDDVPWAFGEYHRL